MGQQAGLNLANRRGLLNSNIALGSAMAEGYKAALPLAQQEAQTAAARNLATIDNQAQMQRLRLQTGSAERMQGSDIAAQRERLQISNDAQMAQLERQLTGASQQQQVEIRAQMDRLRETNSAEMARLERSGQLDTAARAQQGLIQGGLNSQQNSPRCSGSRPRSPAQAPSSRPISGRRWSGFAKPMSRRRPARPAGPDPDRAQQPAECRRDGSGSRPA